MIVTMKLRHVLIVKLTDNLIFCLVNASSMSLLYWYDVP